MAELNGVIFDMDGLIFDTELLYYQATQIVADQMAIPYTKDVYLAYVGVSDEEVWAAYHERYDAAFGPETVDRFIQAAFDQTLLLFEQGQAALKPGSMTCCAIWMKKGFRGSLLLATNDESSIHCWIPQV